MAKKNAKRFVVKRYNEKEYGIMTRKISSYLRSLAGRRNDGLVCADDVHTYLTRDGVRQEQVRTRLSFINSVFSSGAFEQEGSMSSVRPSAKGRAISTWAVA